MCVGRDVCKGWSGQNQIICEFMLHVVGKAQYVCGGGGAGCCRGRLGVYWRECLQGQTGINPDWAQTKQHGQDEAGEVRKDRIRGPR